MTTTLIPVNSTTLPMMEESDDHDQSVESTQEPLCARVIKAVVLVGYVCTICVLAYLMSVHRTQEQQAIAAQLAQRPVPDASLADDDYRDAVYGVSEHSAANTRDPVSYNFCRANQSQPCPFPFIRVKQLPGGARLDGEYMRITFHETMYDAVEGMFVLLMTAFGEDPRAAGYGEDYYVQFNHVKPQLERFQPQLSCWDSITQKVVPSSRNLPTQPANFELRCPYPDYPALLPPADSTFTLIVIHGFTGDYLTPISYSDLVAKGFAHAELSICAKAQRVQEFGWCSNGLRGSNMDVRLREFVAYHHYLGVDKFVFFDENLDGHYEAPLREYIDAGVTDYVRFPHLVQDRLHGYYQDVQIEICRMRLFHVVRWIAFWDIDEFLVINQPGDDAREQLVYGPNEQHQEGLPMPLVDNFTALPTRTEQTLLHRLAVQLQNLPSSRDAHLVGTSFTEMLATEDAAPGSQSLVERFPRASQSHDEFKYFFRVSASCRLSGHTANCPGRHTTRFLRTSHVMIYHLYNSLEKRKKTIDKPLGLAVTALKQITDRMRQPDVRLPLRGAQSRLTSPQ